jgi:hypothetical protein
MREVAKKEFMRSDRENNLGISVSAIGTLYISRKRRWRELENKSSAEVAPHRY